MREFVLDASLALRWCFEDEATFQTESLLTALQGQEAVARVPPIWRYEMVNGLGKGVMRQRIAQQRASLLWREIGALPIHVVEVPVDESLLDLSLEHDLSAYDACYLSLAQTRRLSLATVDGKLRRAAMNAGLTIVET